MSKYTAEQIKNWDVDTEAPSGGWVPARPLNLTGIVTRCRHALGVLTGWYDVLDWEPCGDLGKSEVHVRVSDYLFNDKEG